MMDKKPVVCTLKAPQTLTIGDSIFHSGCTVMDVSFPSTGTSDIGSISFRNNYVAFLTILCKVKGQNGKTEWKRALKKKKLMPDPHIENKGQAKFVIGASEFKCNLNNVTLLRFVMMQPSPCWISFGLKEVKLFPPETIEELSITMPRWLLQSDSLRLGIDEDERRMNEAIKTSNLPDPLDLSSALHALWNLADKSSDDASSVSVGRFDIDGCYEINLLSYGQN